MDIYPYSFKNPYSSMFTGSAKDDELYKYQSSEINDAVVKYQVSYYLWEGGYELSEDKKVMTIFNQTIYVSNENGMLGKDDNNVDEKYFTDGLKNYLIEFDDGITKLTLGDIYKINHNATELADVVDYNYNEDKTKIKDIPIDEFKKLEYDGYNFYNYYRLKVDSNGYIDDKAADAYIKGAVNGEINSTKYVMFRIDSKYTLSAEEGCDVKTIHEVILTVKDENHQINDNKYCNTNGDLKFYTRYKFGADLFKKIPGITFGKLNAFINTLDELISKPFTTVVSGFSFESEKLFDSGESFYLLQQNGGYSTKFSEAVTVVMKSRNGEGGSITIQ